MNASSLEHKTIRPGSLAGYSYYHSNRHPMSAAAAAPQMTAQNRLQLKVFLLIAAAIVVVFGFTHVRAGTDNTATPQITAKSTIVPDRTFGTAAAPVTKNNCDGNTLDHFVVISVSQRHLWACEKAKEVHDTPVITGMMAHESTLTPPGTYHVYAKTTDTTLTGTDETGSWNDPVSYWMPFFDNQHGTYGFHDATWRADSEFGSVDPNSSDASHGCIELPMASSKWLYDWAPVGTTVTVKN